MKKKRKKKRRKENMYFTSLDSVTWVEARAKENELYQLNGIWAMALVKPVKNIV